MFSILLGVLASILPNLVFVWLYKLSTTRAPERFIKSLYISEGIKFAGMALLQCAFLQWPGLQIERYFGAFVCAELIRLFYIYAYARKTAL